MIKQRGFILFTIILLAMLVTATIVGLTIVGQHSALLAGNQFAGEQAYYAAESGLAAGLVELKRSGKLPSNPWTQELAGGPGNSFTVEMFGNSGTTDMDIPGGPTLPPGTTYLMSVGESRGRRRQVGATIAPVGGAFPVGALAQSFQFYAPGAIDAYNSNDGPYGPSTIRNDVDLLATNEDSGMSTIPYAGRSYFTALPVSVKGKVFVGPSGDPGSQVHPLITHQGAETLDAPIDIPDIVLPTGLAKYGDKTVAFGTQTLPPGDYKNVTVLGPFARLKLVSGGRYIFENLHVAGGGQLVLDNDATDVEVYVNRRLAIVLANSVVNTTKKAKSLTFFCTGRGTNIFDCAIAGGAQAYYTLIAPERDVSVVGGGHIYGSIMSGKAITFIAAAAFHYDVALRDSSPAGGFAIVSRHRL